MLLEQDFTGLDRLEQVDAAQQRRFAAAGGADQADDFVVLHHQVDVLQNQMLAIRLVEAIDLQKEIRPHRAAHLARAPLRRALQGSPEPGQRDRSRMNTPATT
ncbi:MAG: hypothetical protein U0075_10150 [Thermomicrobiales bacterium]